MGEHRVQLPSGPTIGCRVDGLRDPAPVLVLLNGAIFNLRQWDRLIRSGGWPRRFRLIRYDYAGTGGSSPRGGPVGVEALVAELVSLLDALEIEAAHFYGLSQGTIVLQGLAGLAPERIVSAGGYGWYHGDFSGVAQARSRLAERIASLEPLRDVWDRPLDRPAFERLWASAFRAALFQADWARMSWRQRAQDRLMRWLLFPWIAPTPIREMADWFAYAAGGLEHAQPLLRAGLSALAERPLLVQHAVADQTLAIGMARELTEAVPGSRRIEHGEGYDHVSVAFRRAQARRIVADHLAFLDERLGG